MTPERWRRVKDVLDEALEIDPRKRAAFLDRACAGDRQLRREVESLLASEEVLDGFLAAPVEELAAAAGLGEPREVLAGWRVGPYRIVREIGHGGMGTVYLAERADGQYRKQVAIKLVNPHLGAASVLARFRHERQVLADLNHPNIAGLVDGGATEEGLPYLVMEYVDGERIDIWCDRCELSVGERLKLFRSVCAAVQYAHERQVIHRDIKPANILVTADGTPKLLDFGIAKVLHTELPAHTLEMTTMGPAPMTPGYASPEQVRGEPVGTATDIYSLGTVLYELLTGHQAHHVESPSPGEIERAICTREPKKPSSLVKGLDPDLDSIVLLALRKEPERRYGSAAELAADLDRFLRDDPVRARAESLLYRGRKFLRRNRALIASAIAGVMVALLVVGLRRLQEPAGGATANVAKAPERKGSDRWNRLNIERIAALGDPAPGGGAFTKDFEPWTLNRAGDLAFVAETADGNTEGVFLWSKGRGISAIPFARVGEPAPGGGTMDGGVISYASINDSGDVAFAFGLAPFTPSGLKGYVKAGLYRYSHADRTLHAIVVPGVTNAPELGVFQSTGQHATLNNSGDIVFTGIVRTTAGLRSAPGLGAGIFVADRDGHIAKVAAPGDAAPGGGKFDFASNPWINDLGDVAFGGHVADDECISITSIGPGCAESVYVKGAATGQIKSIAHQGAQAPGGGLFRWAWGPMINARGDVLFMGELSLAGVAQARGINLNAQGATHPIALPGDQMPDGRRIVTVNPGAISGNYSLNNRGEISFNASLENGESGLYVYSEGALHLVAGTGTTIPGIGTVSSVTNLIIGGGALNDNGQIAFGASLTDGTGLLLVATPPLPGNSKR